MTRQDMLDHTAHWIAAWNRRDLDAVLRPFAEDARFVSPKAQGIVGTALLEGKKAIGDYWRRALERIGPLEFRLGHVTCDPEQQELVCSMRRILAGPPCALAS